MKENSTALTSIFIKREIQLCVRVTYADNEYTHFYYHIMKGMSVSKQALSMFYYAFITKKKFLMVKINK